MRYQRGEASPPPAALKLLRLLHQGRVMPDSWPAHFRFERDRLFTRSTDEPLTPAQLEQINWILGEWNYTVSMICKMERQLAALLELLPAQQLEGVSALREALYARESPPPAGQQKQPYQWWRLG
jgi:hypothetical protein